MAQKSQDEKLFDKYTLQQVYLSRFKSSIPNKITLSLKRVFEKHLSIIAELGNKGIILAQIKRMEADLYKLLDSFISLTQEETKKVIEIIYDSTLAINNSILYRNSRPTEEQEANKKKEIPPLILSTLASPIQVISHKDKKVLSHKFKTDANNIFKKQISYMKWDATQYGLEGIKPEEFITSLPRIETQITSLINTLYFHVASKVKKKVWDSERLLIAYKFSAILDEHTTRLCRSLDGTIKNKLEDLPEPPLHWHCRSFIVPITRIGKESSIDLSNFAQWYESLSNADKAEILELGLSPNIKSPSSKKILTLAEFQAKAKNL